MKKISLIYISIGILFSSLGGKMFVDVENEVEKEKKEIDSLVEYVNDTFKTQLTIIDREKVLEDYNEKIKNVEKTLVRKEYNTLSAEVKKIEYDDIKKELLTKLKSVETKIKKKEDAKKKEEQKKKSVNKKSNNNKNNSAKKGTIYGKVSAYTAYCSDGCGGYTASGRYIGNNIYYNDKKYGKIRIVAGDKSYPFGTIVRFNNLKYYGKPIIAIVLDRGGAVGKGKKVLFDLLFKTEKEANNFGVEKGISCDILRLGY